MKCFREGKQIENVDDFIGYATEVFEQFLQTFTIENKLIREIEEDDLVEENWSFVYTDRGMKLAERMRNRLIRVGEHHFPTDDIEIDSYLFREC